MSQTFQGFPQSSEVVHNISFFTQQASQDNVEYVPLQNAKNVPPAPQQSIVPNTNTNQQGLLTQDQMTNYIEQCKPMVMGNPIKITQPSYLVTEQQMIYLLSLAQGKPLSNLMPEKKERVLKPNIAQETCIVIGNPVEQKSSNVVDTVCNATFGTVGRIGHAFTGVVDSVVDVLTLGFATKK